MSLSACIASLSGGVFSLPIRVLLSFLPEFPRNESERERKECLYLDIRAVHARAGIFRPPSPRRRGGSRGNGHLIHFSVNGKVGKGAKSP